MSAKPCVTCLYYKNRFMLEPVCLHSRCIDPGFDHYDPVTGKTRKWEDTPMRCYKARFAGNACGPGGQLWEASAFATKPVKTESAGEK